MCDSSRCHPFTPAAAERFCNKTMENAIMTSGKSKGWALVSETNQVLAVNQYGQAAIFKTRRQAECQRTAPLQVYRAEILLVKALRRR